MKYMKKIFVFGAILSCVVFLGMRFYDSYASINTERDYILKGEPNTYHETISTNASSRGGDYILRGELNIYRETFSAVPNDIDSYNSEGMYSGDVVIAEPTPLPWQ